MLPISARHRPKPARFRPNLARFRPRLAQALKFGLGSVNFGLHATMLGQTREFDPISAKLCSVSALDFDRSWLELRQFFAEFGSDLRFRPNVVRFRLNSAHKFRPMHVPRCSQHPLVILRCLVCTCDGRHWVAFGRHQGEPRRHREARELHEVGAGCSLSRSPRTHEFNTR